jgi:hypothetical protein
MIYNCACCYVLRTCDFVSLRNMTIIARHLQKRESADPFLPDFSAVNVLFSVGIDMYSSQACGG